MTPDPLRSLDGVDPPDQWEDIVARASGDPATAALADVPAEPTPHRLRSFALAAAAVLVVAAVAGALALASEPSDTDRVSGAEQIWGEQWQLVRVDVGDASLTTDLVSSNGGAVILDAREQGTLMLDVCNEAGGETVIVDGRIVARGWTSEAMACADPLEQLIRLDGTTIDATTDRLVLTKPGFRYEFEPVDALPPESSISGRRWIVTQLTSSEGNAGTEFSAGVGPVLDLRGVDEIVVEGCGPRTKRGKVVGDRLEVEPGQWQELMVDCAFVPRTEHAPMVQEIIDGGATVEREEGRLVVRSGAGSFTAESYAGSSVWDLFSDWSMPSAARWAVVEARVGDRVQDLIGTPVLTVSVHPESPERTIDLSGCGSFGGEITDLDDDENTIRYTPRQGGVGVGCPSAEADQAGWITEVLAGTPTVDVVGARSRITSDAGSMLLVRLD